MNSLSSFKLANTKWRGAEHFFESRTASEVAAVFLANSMLILRPRSFTAKAASHFTSGEHAVSDTGILVKLI